MAFKIVRNDITKMNTEAIVNTANAYATVGSGCDSAVYKAAGYDELLAYRTGKIGSVPEGDAFITPGFLLQAKYIIHAVSPLYKGGSEGEEEKLRSCYRRSLQLAKENEINAFLLNNEMDIYLVVFSDSATSLGGRIYPDLEEYIDQNYVEGKFDEEYGSGFYGSTEILSNERMVERRRRKAPGNEAAAFNVGAASFAKASAPRKKAPMSSSSGSIFKKREIAEDAPLMADIEDLADYNEAADDFFDFETEHESRLEERIKHISDTFSEYLMYLIRDKKMENAEVYKRAIVDKKIFSKIKNNVDYHPKKLTALCLCVGAKLNLDEARDLLARAGYALSPCDKTDIIFSYFIENEIYDMIELDIQLEEHGLPCIIS